MMTAAAVPAPMGVLRGTPPIPGKPRPTEGESLPDPVVVPIVGADTTGVVGEAVDVGVDADVAEEGVKELDPESGPELMLPPTEL